MDIVSLVVLFAAAVAFVFWRGHSAEAEVCEELARDGFVRPEATFKYFKSGKRWLYIAFSAMTPDGKRVTGHATKFSFRAVQLEFDDPVLRPNTAILRKIAAGEQPSLEADAGMDLDTRILFETNQRLERMQGDREAFMNNDLNNDGAVDAEEWELVRERVAAEVRAELTGSAPPPQSPVAQERAPEPEVVAESEVAETDGHW